MPGVADALTEHHRRCRELLAAAGEAVRSDWSAFNARLVELRDVLLGHFRFEEERLFPVYEEVSGLRDATQALRAQHDDIRAILWALSSASAAHDPESCRAEFETLALLFRQHTETEEQMMYPAFERTLGARAEELAAQASSGPAGEALDVRGLEPPEPFLRIMKALTGAPDAPLRVLIHREPFPLYDVLAEQGFSHRTRPLEEGGFEIVIERAAR
ncbi:MAG: hemerythrin domain-containing protein [Burkholderiales bacterium]|nr:hemerythrin domain-containing protein [Burkholderiales bacterium]